MVLPNIGEWEISPDRTSLSGFAIKYPFSGGLKPIGIGALVSVFASLLILPIVLLWGYRYRLSRAGARGDESAPQFNNFGSLVLNGSWIILAFLPYILVIGVLTVVIAGIGSLLPESVAIGVLLLWTIGATYAGLAIHPTFVATGSVRKTYAGLLFLRVAVTRTYLIGFLLGLILRFLVSIIAILVFVISIITIIGPVVVLYIWYAYDEFIPGAVWGHVARDLSQQGLLPAVSPMDELDL